MSKSITSALLLAMALTGCAASPPTISPLGVELDRCYSLLDGQYHHARDAWLACVDRAITSCDTDTDCAAVYGGQY